MFDRATARRFLDAILSRGGSRDALEAFVEFRGRRPDVRALLQAARHRPRQRARGVRAVRAALAAPGAAARLAQRQRRRAATLYVVEQVVVNVNSAPDASGERIATVKSGEALQVIEKSGEQVHVKLASGKDGWVRAGYLPADEPLKPRLAQREAEVAQLKDELARLQGQLAAARSARPAAAAPPTRPPTAGDAPPAPAEETPAAAQALFDSGAEAPVRRVWPWALGWSARGAGGRLPAGCPGARPSHPPQVRRPAHLLMPRHGRRAARPDLTRRARPGQTVRRISVRRLDKLPRLRFDVQRPASGGRATIMNNTRRSDFDVTNTVQVSSPQAVLAAVESLYRPTWPGLSLEPLGKAFAHFERLFAGEVPGWHGVDTVYHDRQHTLDITLALARLLVGYERQQPEAERLGGTRALIGLITGLFHDVGYLRRADDLQSLNGAEFTRTHVTRGARFLQRVPAGARLQRLGAGGERDHPFHRLRGAVRDDRGARGRPA